MRFQIPGGAIVTIDMGFTHDGVYYSPGWLRTATPAERSAIGATEVIESAPVDQRFYFQSDIGDPVPRPIEQIRQTHVDTLKAQARSIILMVFPDWKQTNMVARGVELQNNWRLNESWSTVEETEAAQLQAAWNWIKAVRDHSNILEAEVNGLDFEALTTWQSHDWPTFG
jgi:hypothetical protein